MCGIAGIIKSDASRPDPERLQTMIAALSHRGPDETGLYCKGPAGLAHARLSIIDLAGGKQPMSISKGDLWITFNGEIFNYIELREELIRKGHKFATRSDTEVILHLYQEKGESCVEQLNGQWAFAIWDATRQKLFLSRDRYGVRPLFYTRTPDSFAFASEIKAMFAGLDIPRELDLEGLDQIFTFWVTLPPRTTFRNISQLPPGHSLVFEKGEVRTRAYWKFSYCQENSVSEGQEKQLSEDLLNLLLDATKVRLRSDVPVGAYLSGGLDSTVIAGLAHQLVGDRLRTFSVSFEDPEFDESPYQQAASRYLHTQHSDIPCSYQDIADVFPDVVWHSEQPVLRTAPAPMLLLSRLVHQSGFKVVLTGEGADEILGGYDILKETKIRQFWGKNPGSRWRPLLLKRLYPYMEDIQRQPQAYLQRFFHVSAEELDNPLFSHLPRWALTARLKAFFSDDVRAVVQPGGALSSLEQQLPEAYAGWTLFNRAEYLETRYLLPGYILSSQGDRMAMANAVEGRYPFLDYRVVEFAAKLPTRLKMKVLNQKHLLKQACDGLIPPAIQKRYKQPYRAPDGKSFFRSANYLDDVLSPRQIEQAGIFDPRAVAALIAKFKTGRSTSVKDNMALVGILSTQLLLEQFIHQQRGPSLCKPTIWEKCAVS
ncbi:MAG TPA: asparagine synthase (glutamine-hydrolyzing) [Terriglobales bacterium]|jgi:asparagine synthase (glutamine-hydrolysing)|nr:asparagine synthase (glutamine-hydrolyzing) [Terriglobales bacterium]